MINRVKPKISRNESICKVTVEIDYTFASYTTIFFMTNRLRVLSAKAVCEPLYEGTEDYCIIVCDQCMNIDQCANPASTPGVRSETR